MRAAQHIPTESPPRARRPSLVPLARALPEPGEHVGPYRILCHIGTGGMGSVFEAEHERLQRRVALKVLDPELALQPDLRERFVREGLAAARVRHPNIVEIFDAGEADGRAYLVMELLEGWSLAEELHRRGRFEPADACEIVLPICAALAVTHAIGVVHRDIKPENVFLVDASRPHAKTKVLDFGVADLIGEGVDEAFLVGTPHYMAPEQALGTTLDGRADQYSLAVVLYEMLSGRLPYEASPTQPMAVMLEVRAGEVLTLHDRWSDAPGALNDVLARALSPQAEARFPTMIAFAQALLPFASARTVRRYRDLVDPGWSAMMPSAPPPANVLPIASPESGRAPARTRRDEAPTEITPSPVMFMADDAENVALPARTSVIRSRAATLRWSDPEVPVVDVALPLPPPLPRFPRTSEHPSVASPALSRSTRSSRIAQVMPAVVAPIDIQLEEDAPREEPSSAASRGRGLLIATCAIVVASVSLVVASAAAWVGPPAMPAPTHAAP